jgi:hypothetical protein|tara:strand:+ start:54 stop:236 length:183 start_codon:yes stop_codon:yes gene_type:complete
MSVVPDPLTEIRTHERECAIRYEYIEKRLDEGSAKFKRLESLIWGVYPFIAGAVVLAKFL